MSFDWVLVEVGFAGFEVASVRDKVVGVAGLPDGERGFDAAGEASLDALHCLGQIVGS